MGTREPVELMQFLAPYPPEVQELTLRARLRMLEMLRPVSEIFYDATTAVCSGFMFTGEVRDNFVNLAVYSNHVTLIFPFGIRLEDPERRLKGDGNQVRHIRLAGLQTLDDPYVVGLIRQAETMAARPPEPIEPRTVVKVMKGPKRRPKRA